MTEPDITVSRSRPVSSPAIGSELVKRWLPALKLTGGVIVAVTALFAILGWGIGRFEGYVSSRIANEQSMSAQHEMWSATADKASAAMEVAKENAKKIRKLERGIHAMKVEREESDRPIPGPAPGVCHTP